MFVRRRPLASVQAALLDLDAVRGDVLVLKRGDMRAVLEVQGIDLGLKSPEEQEALLESYRALLNGLDRPVQLVSHAAPQDVDAYLDGLRAPADSEEPEALVRLRLDHFAFVRELAARRTLLRRRFFVVVVGPPAAPPAARPGLVPFVRRREAGEASGFDAARRQLDARAEELRQGLQGLGLGAYRLGHDELVRLLHEALAPQQAARQRLAPGPTQLVVRAARKEAAHALAV